MTPSIQRVRAEVRFDRDAFARRAAELGSIDLVSGPEGAPQRAQAAVALHHAYGSLESIMVRVSRCMEGDIPGGGDWHLALLHSMGLDIQGMRPAVFSSATIGVLRRLLGFRRFFRHAYAVELDPERLVVLRDEIVSAAPAIVDELDALDGYLARVSQAG